MSVFETQSLMTETQRLLKSRKQTLAQIHAATGLPFHWLSKFSGSEMKDPSVNRVQKLYEYLSGRSLLS